MSITGLRYFIFDHVPGAHPSWTLAVLAITEKDARDYVRTHNGHGAKLQRVVERGKVDANCGAVTSSASAILAIED